MKTIKEFKLKKTSSQHITMPIGAKILNANYSDGKLCLWAIVDTSAEKEQREIGVYGSAEEVNEYDLVYISTVQEHTGALVWHIFENK